MKYSFLLVLLMLITSLKVLGQQNDSLSNLKSSPDTTQPLYLVKTHHKTFILDSFSGLNPDWIGSLYVTKKLEEITTYGDRAKAGIVAITLNEKKYPEAYNELKPRLTRLKPNFRVPKGQPAPAVVNIR